MRSKLCFSENRRPGSQSLDGKRQPFRVDSSSHFHGSLFEQTAYQRIDPDVCIDLHRSIFLESTLRINHGLSPRSVRRFGNGLANEGPIIADLGGTADELRDRGPLAL